MFSKEDYCNFVVLITKIEKMNSTNILKKGKALVLWVYKNKTNKFTHVYNNIKNRFLVFESYPLLKYSLIPILIGLFLCFRYIIKFIVNELAVWSSDFAGETMGFNISKKTIVLSVAAVFILLRIGLQIKNQKTKIN